MCRLSFLNRPSSTLIGARRLADVLRDDARAAAGVL
jgi:hypothetical protein